jgi:hypothetical protein
MSHRGKKPARPLVTVTHEPEMPQNWPHGHVGVVLTEDTADECIEVTIHGIRHNLHSTTARELEKMLSSRIESWNLVARAAGYPTV